MTDAPVVEPKAKLGLLLGSDRLSTYIGVGVAAAIEILQAVDALTGTLNLSPKWHAAALIALAVGRALNVFPKAAALILVGCLAAPAYAQETTPTGLLPSAGACFAGGAACLQPAVTVLPMVVDFRSGNVSQTVAFSFGYGIVFARMLNESFRPGVDFLGGTQTGGGWNAAILGRLGSLRIGPVVTHKPGVTYAGLGVGLGM